MTRNILIYGAIAGALTITSIALGIVFGGEGGGSELVGYTIMLVALSLIFIGVKRYRDNEQGGVIRFWTAFQLGLGMAVVAGLVYVIGWEFFLWQTDYAFFGDYMQSEIAKRESAGASAQEIAAFRKEMSDASELYSNPVYRMPISFTEIFPIAALVALVSAAVLRNSKVLPAQ
ncbi:MAG: DUF4199 domain-containing protein [Pseudomonadota bacterium]